MYSSIQKISLFFGLSLFVVLGIISTAWCPFLPNEFNEREISESTVGVVIASDEVANLLASVLFMTIQNVEHRRYSFCIGACSLGVLFIVFGQLMFIKSNTVFVVFSIVVRFLMGVALSVFFCSGSALFLSMFPEDPGKIFSYVSMAMSVGFILGTPVGSFCYGFGGYTMPFLIVGSSQVILSILTFFILPSDNGKLTDAENNATSLSLETEKQPSFETQLLSQTKNSGLNSDLNDEKAPSSKTYLLSQTQSSEKVTVFQFLTNKGVISLSLAVTITASTVGFFFVSLGPLFLDEFQIPCEKDGLYFLPFTMTRALSAPLLGYITDLGYGGLCFTLFGCALSAASLTLLGLAGFAHWLDNLTSIEILLAIIGIGSNGATVPFVKLLRKIFQKQSSNIDMEALDSNMAAMYNICFGSGMIIGESLTGGFVFQYAGFYYTCLMKAALCATAGIVSTLYLAKNNLMRNK
ncbi:MFS-type transporter SLC18B1-like [Convolutriloba macropyga]|uniref:MFS-type transporter SLC18B1-like n=1 Tax=Convolutriloba macropyga TaxID=536237 RepID=UPI003F51F166